MVSPQARREQMHLVQERGLSQRRACGLLGAPRSTVGYRLRQPVKDAPALTAMRRRLESCVALVSAGAGGQSSGGWPQPGEGENGQGAPSFDFSPGSHYSEG